MNSHVDPRADRPSAFSPVGQSGLNLPAKVIVSLRAGAVLAVANILCVAILAWAYTSAKSDPKVISVTGSAKRTIQSDLIVWEAKISINDPDLKHGYDELKAATDKAVVFVKARKVTDAELNLSSIWTKKNYARDEKGNNTDKVTSYDLIQTVEITSTDVTKVSEIARRATELIKEGVMLESAPAKYLYTKLADLKVSILAEATKDATTRAQQIAGNSGAKLGTIREARMGVMQINPLHSNAVSDSGNNDTSSYEKEITAIVSARFGLE
ncbi:MAG: SIMPL domain-containing protein [Tepidisphaeraceae bacterium]